MARLSRLWKGLEDIGKALSDETVGVPVDKFVTLVKQVYLLLGQAFLSVSYTRRLNILKMIMKYPRKAKAMLKENENILKEIENYLFGKKFRSHMTEVKKSRKKSLEAFKYVGEKKSPFRRRLSQFVKQWEKIKRDQNFVNSEGVSGTIHCLGEASEHYKKCQSNNLC